MEFHVKILDVPVFVAELKLMAEKTFGNIVKAVVDIEIQKIGIDAEMHADLESLFLERGSKQKDLWGINLHPDDFGTDEFVEFDSMINIRPVHGNRTRSVDDAMLQARIREIVKKAVVS